MRTSTAYIIVKSLGYRYFFDGVTSVSHNLSLSISTDSDSSEDYDLINNARNEADVVTLSVVASDANTAVIGWSSQTMRSLAQIKEYRLLCTVVTSLRTYDNMLLTGLNVQQDESCPDGWTGTLTFTKSNQTSSSWSYSSSAYSSGTPSSASAYSSGSSYTAKPVSTGSAAAKSAGSQGGSVLQTILREAGING